LLHDLFQALFQLVDERGEIVPIETLAALLLEALDHLPDAFEVTAHPPLHATPHQVAQRLAEIAMRPQLVGHSIHQVVCINRQRLLRAIPL
jgi:hypothetical protein